LAGQSPEELAVGEEFLGSFADVMAYYALC
jgi:hypothetical protein